MKIYGKQLQEILNRAVDFKKIFGNSFGIKVQDATWFGSAGNLSLETPYFIASTTKLFTTAIIMILCTQEKLKLSDPIALFLPVNVMNGLHIVRRTDYSRNLTIAHLLAHTSGLPDYFQDKDAAGDSIEKKLVQGKDMQWSFEKAIAHTKSLKPHFIPGTKKSAHYSDTNFQLLGAIIESITGKPFTENCSALITEPLNLRSTYVYSDPTDTTPKALNYKSEELRVPMAMTSFGADGGIVSTTPDLLTFIEAFFTGKLFPSAYSQEMKQWNNIFFPMQSGLGIHRFKLPWIFNPFGMIPELIGHSGLSGSVAFHSPKHNLYIAGTVNQVAYPDLSFKLMIKLIRSVLKGG